MSVLNSFAGNFDCDGIKMAKKIYLVMRLTKKLVLAARIIDTT